MMQKQEFENTMQTLLERALHYVECYDLHFPHSGANWVADELREEIEHQLQDAKNIALLGEGDLPQDGLPDIGAFDGR